MRARAFFSAVFLVVGTALLVGTLALVLGSLDAPARLISVPEGAAACVDEVVSALSQGDFPEAERRIYGLSEQADSWEPSDEAGALIWQAYLDSITFDPIGAGYATQTGLAWDVTVTTMDISRVTAAASEHAGVLLEKQVSRTEGEEYALSDEQTASLLYEAAQMAIEEEESQIVREIQLNLIQTDGAWYVLPDAQLLMVLSGNLKE